ncbi:hypothetical protein Slala03_45010 [Streptomyces lavendulae subsp. lavendulae]|uniref:hypothetical protein n=1 Tax=Streptomyces lavendulae TaxID=1914 RepID=UPI0024A23E15|nr:hypothetical protein [Streptomyces lavendulae]GLV84812.1 hypothetical protein Slala03_45010 [Streptomyces lavendulae subsp. lavendulae]
MTDPAAPAAPADTTTAHERASAVIDRLHAYWAGREVVLLVNRYDGATRALADELTACGAVIAAVVAGSRCEPGAFGARHVWNCADHGISLPRARFDAWLREPPAELVRWLDDLDPDRTWTALGTTYTDTGEFCSRPVHGWWRREWAHWEDKTEVDALWERAGTPAPPYEVLPVDSPDLTGAVARLDRGRGVVLAADATRSALGSSKGLRWVRRPDELQPALDDFAGTTDRLRVAAFMPGVPFSIMGMVLDSGVAAFEPFEIITLRDPADARLVYGGTSTWWRADPEVRRQIRHHTRLVGERLAAEADYRGMFSIDGLATGDGFAVTELNPRHVSGLSLWAGWPEFPARLFNRAVQERVAGFVDSDWQDIEDSFSEAIRRSPAYMVKIPLEEGQAEQGTGTVLVPGGPKDGPEPDERAVRYSIEPKALRVLDVDQPRQDGAVAPLAAEVANRLCSAGLVSFLDDHAH